MDSFFNECRAYGRLIDRRINRKVLVHYGYLMILVNKEDELRERFEVTI